MSSSVYGFGLRRCCNELGGQEKHNADAACRMLRIWRTVFPKAYHHEHAIRENVMDVGAFSKAYAQWFVCLRNVSSVVVATSGVFQQAHAGMPLENL